MAKTNLTSGMGDHFRDRKGYLNYVRAIRAERVVILFVC